jgi:hypothetical protein
MRRFLAATALAVSAVAIAVGVAAATPNGSDTLVTVGSPSTPFPQNKQNEPAVAVNPNDPSIAAAGVNEEMDLEACNNRGDKTCPFTPGVGTSGVYFSDDGGSSWQQPTNYTGWTARDCVGVVDTQPANPADNCDPHVGPIGTLPRYFEKGLVSDGDPAVAFGPQRGSNGKFDWSNGWRLYYANITSSFNGERAEGGAFKGFEAAAVSRLDSQDYADAKAGVNTAWKAPVIVTKQNASLFSDHEMVAVDDASSSPFFGNVYVCDAAFRSQQVSGPEPIVLNSSSDGGDTWSTRQLSQAENNSTIGGRQDCAVNTDSTGTVYVFWDGADPKTKTAAIFMSRSFDGGRSFVRPAQRVTHIVSTGIPDFTGDSTFDGQAGARDGSFPTVDIANGAPTGADATDEIVLAWSNGPTPSDTSPGPNEQVKVMTSTNGGDSWAASGVASPAGDRPDFPAIAISPNGTDAYLTYMNFKQPWQSDNTAPRLFQGVVRHADVTATGAIGAWSDLNRAPTGDARGSSANALIDEFLGDYDYAFATRNGVVAVWNDARNAANCSAIDAYRDDVADGTAAGVSTDPTRPAPQQDCTAAVGNFGNTNIYGGSYADPTP